MVQQENLPTKNGGQRVPTFAHPFEILHHDMDRLLDRYFPQSVSDWFHDVGEKGQFARMGVTESDKSIDIRVDVPGVDEGDIDVTLNDNVLTIKGSRESSIDEEEDNCHRIERSFGNFARRIELPSEVDGGKVDASIKKGVLKVHLPKSAKAKAKERKISVKTS